MWTAYFLDQIVFFFGSDPVTDSSAAVECLGFAVFESG